MQTKGISIAPRAMLWLAGTKRGRVIHLFPKVVNLINQEDQVLSVVVPAVGNGPFTMVVDADQISGVHGLDDRVVVSSGQLTVGMLEVFINTAAVWDPMPGWGAINTSFLPELIKLIETRLKSRARSGGIADVFYLDPSGKQKGYPYLERMESSSRLLLKAVLHKDEIEIKTSTRRLAGLGVGLTPSGDDFLIGVMYALRLIKSEEEAEGLSDAIRRIGSGRTTRLSGAWFEAASSGEAGERWHQLVRALKVGDRRKIDQAIRAILEVGETSGADALTGFVQYLKMEMEA